MHYKIAQEGGQQVMTHLTMKKLRRWFVVSRVFTVLSILLFMPEIVLAKRLVLDNGVYEGSVRSGQPSGHGTMKFKDGKVYVGNFKKGRAHGFGKLIRDDGSSYSGDWKKGIKDGGGRSCNSLGDCTEGKWLKGKLDGIAKKILANGDTYEGSWVDGRLSGDVTYKFASGDVYIGPILEDQPEGIGEYTVADTGDRYIGGFKLGKRDGKGTVTFQDGSKFKGNWLAGEPLGEGIHSDSRGNTFKGDYYAKVYINDSADDEIVSKTNSGKPSCEKYSYQILASVDRAWSTIDFDLKSGTSSCID